MKIQTHLFGLLALGVLCHAAPGVAKPYGYAYNSSGQLFTFDLTNPGSVIPVGPATAGANVRAIDTRPGTSTLYAVDVLTGTSQVQVFMIDPGTGDRTAVGPAIPASGTAGDANPYIISTASAAYGLDFNPTTLQGDGSSRFRFVTAEGVNLRFNSATGAVTNVDGNLAYTGGVPATLSVAAGAYTNSDTERMGGMVTPTTLYYIDTLNDALVLSANANSGAFVSVGALGVDLNAVASFDIFTSGGNPFGYVVASADGGSTYSLYTINLATGALTATGAFPTGFEPTRGFAIVDRPEPSLPVRATGFAYNATGQLFSFPLSDPSLVTPIGPAGQSDVKGIDFLPGTNTLYAIAVGQGNSQLRTVNLNDGTATPIGSGFANAAATPGNYSIASSNLFGFDFNPTTLQGDGSIRIRLVDSAGTNLRLHSATGGVAAVDTGLTVNAMASPGISAAAYTNTDTARAGATAPGTRLYYLDANNDVLLTSPAANSGVSTVVGPLGSNVTGNTAFDILSFNGENVGFVVVGSGGGFTLRRIDLQTGALGSVIGTFPAGFEPVGGFATTILPFVDTLAPRVITQGPSRIRVGAGVRSFRLQGRASDDTAVTGVFVKPAGGTFLPAKGTNRWSESVDLDFGRNVFVVVARDAAGNRSTPDRIVIIRGR
ncbi:MAG: DUF4394 domain-containing protein [Verrucomicrobiales bacterium]|nr:DUF4394 domain-containing protein [Verrucomicrobiales bacterium]